MKYDEHSEAEFSSEATQPIPAPPESEVVLGGHLLLNEENWEVGIERNVFQMMRRFDFCEERHASVFQGRLNQLAASEDFTGAVSLSPDCKEVALSIRVQSDHDLLRRAASVANECDVHYRMFLRPLEPEPGAWAV